MNIIINLGRNKIFFNFYVFIKQEIPTTVLDNMLKICMENLIFNFEI